MVTMAMSCLLETRSVEPDSSVIRYIVQCNIQSSEFNTKDKCHLQQKAPQGSEFNTEDKWQQPYSPKLKNHDF